MIFSDGSGIFVGNIVNVSFGGAFVSTASTPVVSRQNVFRCVFSLDKESTPICIAGQVKRIVPVSQNPEIFPGLGFSFAEDAKPELAQLEEHILNIRRNLELAATILSSGDPDWSSLGPVLVQLHLPPFQDLAELKFLIERILKSVEIVDQLSKTSQPA